jgi:outer membrane protein TolC
MKRTLRAIVVLALGLALGPGVAAAQGPPEPRLPREGGQPLAASAPTLSLAAQNPFMGGVPSGQVMPSVVPLSLTDAIARGLEHNLGVVLGEQGTRSAAGAHWTSLSRLLPNLSGRLTEERQTVNLEAFGFPLSLLPPGLNPVVGPFDVFDARLAVSQPVFDYSAIQGNRAGALGEKAARFSYQDVRDTVVFVIANLYLQAISGASRIDAVQAQVKTSQALYDRAVDMKKAGVVAGIEVLRAQVQLQSQQQRLIFYQNEFAKQKLALARAIGLPLAQQFDLTDRVPYAALPAQSLDESLRQAYASRSDLKSALAGLRAAEANRQAARGLSFPSVAVSADIGDIGLTPSTAKKTYTLGAFLRVPVFQGGLVHGRLLQTDAALQQQRAQVEDLRGRIDYEVRAALLDIKAADDQVQVAKGTVDLGNQQLVQAQDRFAAGVASNIEVVQAQEAVATATDNFISSLYAHNLAKLSLARALGVAEASASQFLGGQQ